MNASPVPTLLQRQALAAYLNARRDAIYHAERTNLHRATVPAPQVEVIQPEPVQMCAEPEADSDMPLSITLAWAALALAAWALFGWAVVVLIEAVRGVL